jgi:mannosyltransferase
MSTQSQVCDSAGQVVPRSAVSSIQTKLWLFLLLVVAFSLRIVELRTRSFWLDEAASSMLAHVDWHSFVRALSHRQANMALYYVFLRAWVYVGDSESWIRFLSVIFGVAAIPVIYRVGELVLGPRCGRIAALLLAVHAFHIAYSQEARGYSLAVLLALLSCYFFLRLMNSKTNWTWVAYVLSSVLMVYTQVLGMSLLLAQWLYAAFRWNTWNNKKRTLWAVATIGLFVTPLLALLILNSDRSQLAWMNQTSVSTLRNVLLDLSGRGGTPLLVLDLILLAGSGLLRSRKNGLHSRPRSVTYVFLWFWAFMPVMLIALISLRWPIMQTRYLIVCLPAFLLLVADGLAQVRWRVVFIAVLMVMVALLLTGASSYLRSRGDLEHSDNWRDATHYILAQAQPGDAILFPYSSEEIAFREYQRRVEKPSRSLVLVPEETDLELLSTAGNWTTSQAADGVASLHSRVWMISALQPNSCSRAVQTAIEGHLPRSTQLHFGFVTVRVFAGTSARAQ